MEPEEEGNPHDPHCTLSTNPPMDVSQFLQRLHSTRSAAVTTVVEVAIGALFLILVRNLVRKRRLKSPPAVPGWPLIGNLLEMNEKEPPHLTFSRLAERYGPIYRLRLGSTTLFVLNSVDVAREAMVTRFHSITTKKLPLALKILSGNEKSLLLNILGANAQRRHRVHRDFMVENMVRRLHEHVKSHPLEAVDFRKIFQSEIFRLSVKEVSKWTPLPNREVESLYVEELGATLSSEEQYQVLVTDVMEGSVEVDWRDFFPYLRWIPNRSVETKLQRLFFRREVVLKALINVQKKRIASGEELNCYIDHLLSEASFLREEQVRMLLWEVIMQSTVTTLVASESAMYELSKDLNRQVSYHFNLMLPSANSAKNLCIVVYQTGLSP
uniref:Ent-kaurene oxidase n=1 Tax=Kalanchoe fedtschenkoi TaxID=63787 RepID=A0A7N0TPY9_KALFE